MPVISKKFIQKGTPKATPDVGYTGGPANLFFFLQGCRLGTIGFESCGVGMKGSVVNICSEKDRPLNSISLQNAVLCADCDVVSDSPHDHCLVCGSRSLLNISRLLGGTMPGRRTM